MMARRSLLSCTAGRVLRQPSFRKLCSAFAVAGFGLLNPKRGTRHLDRLGQKPFRRSPWRGGIAVPAILAILVAVAATANPGHRALRTEKQPVIEGDFEDAVWQNVDTIAIQRVSKNYRGKKPLTRPDTGGTARLLWTPRFLYLAVDVWDDDVQPFDPRTFEHENDCIEIFFDPQRNYRHNLQYRILPFGRDAASKGAVLSKRPTYGPWQVATQRNDHGYQVELAIPWSHFMEATLTALGPGDALGFDVAVLDADAGQRRKTVLSWSGDGSGWMDPAQHGTLLLATDPGDDIPALPDVHDVLTHEPANHECGAMWPSQRMIQGEYRLTMPHQSWSNTAYRPWAFGRVHNALTDFPADDDGFETDHTPGPHSSGEHLSTAPRHLTTRLTGTRSGKMYSLERIAGPFHPARVYRTNTPEIVLFDHMKRAGQPTGPSGLAMQLETGVAVRAVADTPVAYDRRHDGPLTAPWLLAWFVRPGDGRDNDIPMLLTLSRNPLTITVTDAGGLRITFDRTGFASVAMMPLYGIKPVRRQIVLNWQRAGELPADVMDRLAFWSRACHRIPVALRQRATYDEEKRQFKVRNTFVYTTDESRWTESAPLLLAPLSPLYSSSATAQRFPIPGLRNLDYPLYIGDAYAVTGRGEYAFDLPIPELPPVVRLDREVLARHPMGREYLAILDKLDYHDDLQRNVKRARKRKHYMPHVMPTGSKVDAMPLLTLLSRAERRRLETSLRETWRNYTFGDRLREKLWPLRPPYLGSGRRVTYLTEPHGVPEPYHGCVNVLRKLALFCEAVDDYSLYEDNWDLIKQIADIVWVGNFTEYRYDGGTMLGETLTGLVRAAGICGDTAFHRRCLYRFSQYCFNIRNFLEAPDHVRKTGVWSDNRAGKLSVHNLDHLQMITRGSILPARGTKLTDHTHCMDRVYGEPALLKAFARDQVARIEYDLLPELPAEHWTRYGDPSPKRDDGIYRRFRVRALTLDEPLDKLDSYAETIRSSAHREETYVGVVLTLLKRIQMDATGG